jgi:uncharacterized protein (TIGR03437 family)
MKGVMPVPSGRATLLVCAGLLSVPTLIRPQTTTTTITPTPASLTFQYTLGPTAKLPAAQVVNLKSSEVNLVATLTVSGDLPSNGDWLEPSIRRGTTIKLPGSVSVTVTPTSLAAGTYNATITFTATDSGGATVTQTVGVRLIILPAPSELDFSPVGGLTFNYTTGSPTAPPSQQFLMYSEGAPLSVTVSVSGAPWLKTSPTGSVQVGGLFKPISVSIDQVELGKLIPKSYTANITVSAPAAINKNSTYPITLNVNAAVPSVTDTWPSGVVLNSSGTGATTVVLDGTGFFDTSTVTATGFTSSTGITVSDSSGTPLRASETISVPVYASGVTFLRVKMGSPLPTGYVGVAYSQDLGALAGGGTGPYTWSATGLTGSGLSLNSSGVLSGTPAAAGTYSVVIQVTDANQVSAYMPVSLTVYGAATPPAGTVWVTVANPLPSATVGTAYTANVGVSGGTGPYSWSFDATTPFPAGLSIATTGAPTTISGTPTSVGSTGVLAQKRLSEGALQVTVPNAYLAKKGVLRMTVHTPTPGGGDSNEAQFEVYGPEPRILAVVNAASYAAGGVAPGELISIFGTGLGPATLTVYDPNGATLPTALPSPAPTEGATQVHVTDGVTTWHAALVYTSATQVGVMIPFEVTGAAGPVTMSVDYGPAGAVLTSKPFQLTIISAAPGIFTADGSGKGQAAALNYSAATTDYTVNAPATPALLRDTPIVVLYLTGFGTTNPASGSAAKAGSGVNTNTPAAVTIDGKAALAVTGVPQGSFPGLLQLNVTVPSDASPGKTVPVTVSIGTADAQSGVTIALK